MGGASCRLLGAGWQCWQRFRFRLFSGVAALGVAGQRFAGQGCRMCCPTAVILLSSLPSVCGVLVVLFLLGTVLRSCPAAGRLMLLDFEVQRCTRRCATSGRKLDPGETFYSVLQVDGAQVVRTDYAVDVWQDPPEEAFAWWKSCIPSSDSSTPKLAPNEVLLELFDQLGQQPDATDMRYILALLLIRRRLLRHDDEVCGSGEDGSRNLMLYCPSREETYQVPEVDLDETRIGRIQAELSELLYADTSGG